MRSREVAFGLLLGCVGPAMSLACGGGEEETREKVDLPESGPIQEDLFAGGYAQALCSRAEECECFSGVSSYNSCFWTLTQSAEEFSLDSIEYDADTGRACLEAVEGSSCDDDSWQDICNAAYRGTVPEGGDCAFDISCSGYEVDEALCSAGVCTRIVTGSGEEGDPCSASCGQGFCIHIPGGDPTSFGNCHQEDGLRCVDDVCAPTLGPDEPCSSVHDCSIGLYCDAGSCVPQIETGEVCFNDENLSCEQGSACVSRGGGGVCEEARPLGALCTFDRQCASYRCRGNECVKDTQAQGACSSY